MNPTPERAPQSVQPWHRLFAPLPPDAIPRRSPVAPPEILAQPEGAAIAGWEHLTVELSVPCEGLRMILVVVDGSGQAISASDMVLYQSETADGTEYRQESVGGRLEADGTFRGTRWRMLTVTTPEGGELQKEAASSEPSEEDISAIKALVAEVLRRATGQADAAL